VFWTILGFELRYHLRRLTTLLFFAVMFLLAFFAVSSDAVIIGDGVGKVFKNSPYVIAQAMTILTAVGQVITTGIVGTAILRDHALGSHELIFTTRITRFGYLGGRFVGAFLVMLLVYSGIPLGQMAGSVMPWVDHSKFGAFHLAYYVQPFLVLVVPNLFFVSALFFAVGVLTRTLFAIYTQGIFLLGLYQLTQQILTDLDNLKLASLLDPFGVTTLDLATRYWSVAEKNTLLVPLTGYILTNRLLWLGVSVAMLAATFALFRFRVEPIRLWRRRRPPARPPVQSPAPLAIPPVTLGFDGAAGRRQLLDSIRFTFRNVIREVPFRAIAAIAVVDTFVGSWYADRIFDTPTWPVTALVANTVQQTFSLYFILLTTIYAGELVWKERAIRADGAVDALPVPSLITLAGKLLGFLGAMAMLLVVVMLTGILVQTIKGYHHYELGLYLRELFAIQYPIIIQVTLLAFAVHVLVNQKYVGHLIMILYYIGLIASRRLGFEHRLYRYGARPDYTYSDMNGYGPFSGYLASFLVYGVLLGLMLGLVAYLFWVRGSDPGGRPRLALARGRFTPRTGAAGVGMLLAAALMGTFIFTNTNVWNRFNTRKAADQLQARYERSYRKYFDSPGPRITAVVVRADLVPERRRFALASTYTAVNQTGRPLDTLLVSLGVAVVANRDSTGPIRAGHYHVDSLVWSRPTTLLTGDTTTGMYLYRLTQALSPGDTIMLAFGAHYWTEGFPNQGPNTDIVRNGTFLSNGYFPVLAYDENAELTDDDRRKDVGLAPRSRALPLDDPKGRLRSDFVPDADWVTFEATVSTAPDQIALAPGYLQDSRMENGRRVFHYRMDAPIQNFYSFVSGAYAVRRDRWRDVNIEIYYYPGHEFDIDRMIAAVKKSLDYYTTQFGPYQYRQVRILEFPRYQVFAQSFPNTIPFSEGIGFISRVENKDDDVDTPLFVTAHEVAHQWWGHQIVGAHVQGSQMLSESLAEYSALMVMEHEQGRDASQKFLRYELDRYLRGRSLEKKKELPLMLVENQAYLHYRKGSLVFYALRDYIGEDRLNSALAKFVADHRYPTAPYPTTRDFMQYIRAVTPDSLQYVITDLFETITLYDNAAIEATAERQADSTWRVRLKVAAHKFRADSLGNQREIPMGDYVDIGVFGEPAKGNKLGRPLALQKVYIDKPEVSAEFVVKERPHKAGIDPYNKLIDRGPEDNVRAVSVKSGLLH